MILSSVISGILYFNTSVYANNYEYLSDKISSKSAIEALAVNTIDIASGNCIIISNGSYYQLSSILEKLNIKIL